MSKKHILNTIIAISLLGTTLTACAPVIVGGTAAVVGTTIKQERSAGQRLDDNVMKVKVKDVFGQSANRKEYRGLSVDVYEGRVMVSGFVSTQTAYDQIQKLVYKVKGVREVINEVKVNPKAPSNRASDALITTTVNSKLLAEKNLSSNNYLVSTHEGVVYVLGVAQDNNELTRALEIARTVKGVQQVVSHVILKDDARRSVKS